MRPPRIDPYTAISEGTLIATVVPGRAEAFVEALADDGIEAAIVGEIRPPDEGRTVGDRGSEEPLTHPGLICSGARSAPGRRSGRELLTARYPSRRWTTASAT